MNVDCQDHKGRFLNSADKMSWPLQDEQKEIV